MDISISFSSCNIIDSLANALSLMEKKIELNSS
jgi:hypothetical protein